MSDILLVNYVIKLNDFNSESPDCRVFEFCCKETVSKTDIKNQLIEADRVLRSGTDKDFCYNKNDSCVDMMIKYLESKYDYGITEVENDVIINLNE